MERNLNNVATVHPLSKLPVPGSSGLKPRSTISLTCKRKTTPLEVSTILLFLLRKCNVSENC